MNERPLFGGIHLHPESNSPGLIVQVPFLLSSIGFESANVGMCVLPAASWAKQLLSSRISKLEANPFICLGWNLIYDVWVVVSIIFYFHPYLGKVSNLINIFQLGWNHQPVIYDVHSKCTCMIFEVLCLCNFLCKRHTAVVVARVVLGLWVATNITPSKQDLLASWKVGVYGISFCHHR